MSGENSGEILFIVLVWQYYLF